MTKCLICGKEAVFKIKNEKLYYCLEHAKEFFSTDCLLNIEKIDKIAKQAQKLDSFLKFNKQKK